MTKTEEARTLKTGQKLKNWYNENGVKITMEFCKVLYLEIA